MSLTCPKCQADMRHYERSGVTVDQCTECRGIFLDRGELERLINAENSWHAAPAAAPAAPAAPPQPAYPPAPAGYAPMPGGHHSGYPSHGYHKKKKHKSFLEELFD